MRERLYYADSSLTQFNSRISDIRLVSRTDGNALWQVSLESSAFYPTSGGQPHDTGLLRASSRSGAVLEVPVIAVEEDEHGEVWHLVAKPLSAGTEVEGVIDWPRRRNHMQQHSGQHLLSAVFATELNAFTTSFHLGEESNTIDLKIIDVKTGAPGSSSIVPEHLQHVERIANELIADDRRVSMRTVTRNEAEALLAASRLRKLPERSGDIRLIEIADYDSNACGGTHVHSTGQIGGLLLRSTEKVRDGLRVEFVCGLRAVALARREYEVLVSANAALTVSTARLPEAVERLIAENKSAAKERQKLQEHLADMHAAQLLEQASTDVGLKVIRRSFGEAHEYGQIKALEGSSIIAADYCKLLASRTVAAASNALVLFAVNQIGHIDQAAQSSSALIIMASSKGQAFSCGELLRIGLAKLSLRGGGSREMAQGQVPTEKVGTLLDALEAAARAATGSAI